MKSTFSVIVRSSIRTDRPEQTVETDQTPQIAAFAQGLKCLSVSQRFYTHQQFVKWTCSKCRTSAGRFIPNITKKVN